MAKPLALVRDQILSSVFLTEDKSRVDLDLGDNDGIPQEGLRANSKHYAFCLPKSYLDEKLGRLYRGKRHEVEKGIRIDFYPSLYCSQNNNGNPEFAYHKGGVSKEASSVEYVELGQRVFDERLIDRSESPHSEDSIWLLRFDIVDIESCGVYVFSVLKDVEHNGIRDGPEGSEAEYEPFHRLDMVMSSHKQVVIVEEGTTYTLLPSVPPATSKETEERFCRWVIKRRGTKPNAKRALDLFCDVCMLHHDKLVKKEYTKEKGFLSFYKDRENNALSRLLAGVTNDREGYPTVPTRPQNLGGYPDFSKMDPRGSNYTKEEDMPYKSWMDVHLHLITNGWGSDDFSEIYMHFSDMSWSTLLDDTSSVLECPEYELAVPPKAYVTAFQNQVELGPLERWKDDCVCIFQYSFGGWGSSWVTTSYINIIVLPRVYMDLTLEVPAGTSPIEINFKESPMVQESIQWAKGFRKSLRMASYLFPGEVVDVTRWRESVETSIRQLVDRSGKLISHSGTASCQCEYLSPRSKKWVIPDSRPHRTGLYYTITRETAFQDKENDDRVIFGTFRGTAAVDDEAKQLASLALLCCQLACAVLYPRIGEYGQGMKISNEDKSKVARAAASIMAEIRDDRIRNLAVQYVPSAVNHITLLPRQYNLGSVDGEYLGNRKGVEMSKETSDEFKAIDNSTTPNSFNVITRQGIEMVKRGIGFVWVLVRDSANTDRRHTFMITFSGLVSSIAQDPNIKDVLYDNFANVHGGKDQGAIDAIEGTARQTVDKVARRREALESLFKDGADMPDDKIKSRYFGIKKTAYTLVSVERCVLVHIENPAKRMVRKFDEVFVLDGGKLTPSKLNSNLETEVAEGSKCYCSWDIPRLIYTAWTDPNIPNDGWKVCDTRRNIFMDVIDITDPDRPMTQGALKWKMHGEEDEGKYSMRVSVVPSAPIANDQVRHYDEEGKPRNISYTIEFDVRMDRNDLSSTHRDDAISNPVSYALDYHKEARNRKIKCMLKKDFGRNALARSYLMVVWTVYNYGGFSRLPNNLANFGSTNFHPDFVTALVCAVSPDVDPRYKRAILMWSFTKLAIAVKGALTPVEIPAIWKVLEFSMSKFMSDYTENMSRDALIARARLFTSLEGDEEVYGYYLNTIENIVEGATAAIDAAISVTSPTGKIEEEYYEEAADVVSVNADLYRGLLACVSLDEIKKKKSEFASCYDNSADTSRTKMHLFDVYKLWAERGMPNSAASMETYSIDRLCDTLNDMVNHANFDKQTAEEVTEVYYQINEKIGKLAECVYSGDYTLPTNLSSIDEIRSATVSNLEVAQIRDISKQVPDFVKNFGMVTLPKRIVPYTLSVGRYSSFAEPPVMIVDEGDTNLNLLTPQIKPTEGKNKSRLSLAKKLRKLPGSLAAKSAAENAMKDKKKEIVDLEADLGKAQAEQLAAKRKSNLSGNALGRAATLLNTMKNEKTKIEEVLKDYKDKEKNKVPLTADEIKDKKEKTLALNALNADITNKTTDVDNKKKDNNTNTQDLKAKTDLAKQKEDEVNKAKKDLSDLQDIVDNANKATKDIDDLKKALASGVCIQAPIRSMDAEYNAVQFSSAQPNSDRWTNRRRNRLLLRKMPTNIIGDPIGGKGHSSNKNRRQRRSKDPNSPHWNHWPIVGLVQKPWEDISIEEERIRTTPTRVCSEEEKVLKLESRAERDQTVIDDTKSEALKNLRSMGFVLEGKEMVARFRMPGSDLRKTEVLLRKLLPSKMMRATNGKFDVRVDPHLMTTEISTNKTNDTVTGMTSPSDYVNLSEAYHAITSHYDIAQKRYRVIYDMSQNIPKDGVYEGSEDSEERRAWRDVFDSEEETLESIMDACEELFHLARGSESIELDRVFRNYFNGAMLMSPQRQNEVMSHKDVGTTFSYNCSKMFSEILPIAVSVYTRVLKKDLEAKINASVEETKASLQKIYETSTSFESSIKSMEAKKEDTSNLRKLLGEYMETAKDVTSPYDQLGDVVARWFNNNTPVCRYDQPKQAYEDISRWFDLELVEDMAEREAEETRAENAQLYSTSKNLESSIRSLLDSKAGGSGGLESSAMKSTQIGIKIDANGAVEEEASNDEKSDKKLLPTFLELKNLKPSDVKDTVHPGKLDKRYSSQVDFPIILLSGTGLSRSLLEVSERRASKSRLNTTVSITERDVRLVLAISEIVNGSYSEDATMDVYTKIALRHHCPDGNYESHPAYLDACKSPTTHAKIKDYMERSEKGLGNGFGSIIESAVRESYLKSNVGGTRLENLPEVLSLFLGMDTLLISNHESKTTGEMVKMSPFGSIAIDWRALVEAKHHTDTKEEAAFVKNVSDMVEHHDRFAVYRSRGIDRGWKAYIRTAGVAGWASQHSTNPSQSASVEDMTKEILLLAKEVMEGSTGAYLCLPSRGVRAKLGEVYPVLKAEAETRRRLRLSLLSQFRLKAKEYASEFFDKTVTYINKLILAEEGVLAGEGTDAKSVVGFGNRIRSMKNMISNLGGNYILKSLSIGNTERTFGSVTILEFADLIELEDCLRTIWDDRAKLNTWNNDDTVHERGDKKYTEFLSMSKKHKLVELEQKLVALKVLIPLTE